MFLTTQSPVDNLIIGTLAVIVLVIVSDIVVNISIRISRRLGISQMFIGLTVISIGTSLPEITTHVVASIDIVTGRIDPIIAAGTVIGTNIGSDIVQQNFIIGLVGLIALIHGRTIRVKREFLKREFLVMILAAALVLLFSLDRTISRVEGAILFFGYAVYLWFLWIRERSQITARADKIEKPDRKEMAVDAAYILAGFIVISLSAEYLLKSAEFFVTKYGIGGSLIGVTVIGIATSLPELTTSVAAIIRGASSISIGTLVGSNITNPLFALGLGAMISTYGVPRAIVVYDLPVNIGTALIIMAFLWSRGKLEKKESLAMIAMYVVYLLVRLKYFAVDI